MCVGEGRTLRKCRLPVPPVSTDGTGKEKASLADESATPEV
jgi:hypothetical protein